MVWSEYDGPMCGPRIEMKVHSGLTQAEFQSKYQECLEAHGVEIQQYTVDESYCGDEPEKLVQYTLDIHDESARTDAYKCYKKMSCAVEILSHYYFFGVSGRVALGMYCSDGIRFRPIYYLWLIIYVTR